MDLKNEKYMNIQYNNGEKKQCRFMAAGLRPNALILQITLLLLLMPVMLLCQGCSGSTDVLKGKWDLDGTTAYEFSGDGNGALLLPNVTYEFTYKIKKDQISIDYENESVRDGAYTFSVDKDKLTLIGGEGTVGGTYTLTRWRKNR